MRPAARSALALAVFRIAYTGLVAFSLWVALAPPHAMHGVPELPPPWDKALHFSGMYGLSLGAAVAFPRAHLLGLALVLIGAGGMIEVVQGLPVSGRDPDFADWLADAIGVCAAYLPLIGAAWRDGLADERFQLFGRAGAERGRL